jgi:large subunit ribosomal protein L31
MKDDIHPKYAEVQVTCSCGNQFTTRSTTANKQLHIEVCSNCHPFYTGKQKVMDTAGRVHHFLLARIERVAVRAYFDVKLLVGGGRARRELVAAAAGHLHFGVLGVDVVLHGVLVKWTRLPTVECCSPARCRSRETLNYGKFRLVRQDAAISSHLKA